MNTPNGDADLLTDRPLQLPKVGWGDDDEETDSSFSPPAPSQDPPEAPVPKPNAKRSSSNGINRSMGVTQRSNVSRPDLELQSIPEDFSMHGPWPDFCHYYDYDADRKKAYRYRMCGRLTFRGFILILLTFLLFIAVIMRIRSPKSSDENNNTNGGINNNINLNNNTSPTPPKLTQQQTQMYELIATSFHPLWYDRSRGWNGTAYLQAYDFCDAQEKRVPCPYVAYCPLGAGYAPSGGMRVEEEVSWAPVLDSGNSWVQVGSTKTCELYSASHKNDEPRWGLTGQGDEEITRNVMCCIVAKDFKFPQLPVVEEEALGSDLLDRPPSLEEDEQGKDSQTEPTIIDTNPAESNAEAIVDEVIESANADKQSEMQQQMQDQSTITTNADAAAVSTADLENIVSFFEPLWFDRSFGWSGTTMAEAEEFCQTRAGLRSVCPYVAYCPKGPAGTVLGGHKIDRLVGWAPMKDWNGLNWVGLGEENACWHASETSEFGLDAEGIRDVTGNIMCCKDKPQEPGGR